MKKVWNEKMWKQNVEKEIKEKVKGETIGESNHRSKKES